MKKNTIMVQLLVKIGLFLGLIAIITLSLGYYFIKQEMDEYQQEQINNATRIVVHAMESTQKSADTIENMIEKKLYSSSKAIMSELRGKQAKDISMAELKALAAKWDVNEISLWERKADDIVITQSSDSTQLNMSSKNWGFWFTAFDQLMSEEEVTVEQGYAMDHFWVGPISKAERFDNIYYKFAYYYDGTTDFMINPFILDEEIYNLTFQAGPNQMIEKIITENIDIAEIAVINVPAWLKGEKNSVVIPDSDLPVLYGTHQLELEEDEQLFQQALQEKENQSVSFEENGTSYKKVYKPLSENRVMAILLNLTRQHELQNRLLLLFLSAFLLSMSALFIIIRLIAKRQLRPLQDIVQHIQGMASGDLTQTLALNEKNELDWLADHINAMTHRFHQLITGVKEESHSLVVVSSLLSKQVYDSVKTMGETSTVMTSESKDILLEIEISMEKLQQLFNTITDSSEQDITKDNELSEESKLQLRKSLIEIYEKISGLENMLKEHTSHATDITLMFYDTLQELKEALQRMDQLSTKLNNKIMFFKVKDEQ